jgi:hypothetical protein
VSTDGDMRFVPGEIVGVVQSEVPGEKVLYQCKRIDGGDETVHERTNGSIRMLPQGNIHVSK